MRWPWFTARIEPEMVSFVVPPEDTPGPGSKPLMTQKDMKEARRTLARVNKILTVWDKQDHTYAGGVDSLLLRVYPEFRKALDEVDRLWKRWGR